MSQSDYIKYKRVATQLKRQSTMAPVLTQDNYVQFKEFSLENSIISNNVLYYDRYIPPNIPIVFGVVKEKASACSEFALCTNTDERPNRRPLGPERLTSLSQSSIQPYYKKRGTHPIMPMFCSCLSTPPT